MCSIINNGEFVISGLNDRNLEQGYNWADNTGVNYVNWRAGEPNDRDGAENCVEMQTRSGQWNDLSCNRRLPFMCKHKLGKDRLHFTF